MLAERAHQIWVDQPGQSLVLAKRAHGINRISGLAVLIHARTFGLIQAAPYEKEQASFERLLDGSFKRAAGDQTGPCPGESTSELDHL